MQRALHDQSAIYAARRVRVGIVQECAAGLITIRHDGDRLAFAAPPMSRFDVVLGVRLPAASEPGFDVGLVGLHAPGGECAIEVRAFFADRTGSIREDPVTGSLNASVAQWLTQSGRVEAPYVAAQGASLGRRGRVYVDADDGELWIGGRSTAPITGTLDA